MAITRVRVEPLPNDLVAQAQCMALDASVFPSASMRFGVPTIEPSYRVWIARAGEGGAARPRVIGFIAGVAEGRRFYIYGLAVDASERRRGVGRALVRRALAESKRARYAAVALHVAVGNRPAVELYEREGFVASRRQRGYYRFGRTQDERDAYEMVYVLAR